jgi:hypothetical protein
MTALADFDINGDGGDRGFDATASQVLTFTLRTQPPHGIRRWTLQVFDADTFDPTEKINVNPPRQSAGSPELTLIGATSGQLVAPSTLSGEITCTLPSSAFHAWIIRSVVNGGKDDRGRDDSSLIRERMVVIRDACDRRPIVITETTQYSTEGWPAELSSVLTGGVCGSDIDELPGSDGPQWVFPGVDGNVDFGPVLAFERTDHWSVTCFIRSTVRSGSAIILGAAQATSDHRGWTLYSTLDGSPHFKLVNTHNSNDLDVAGDQSGGIGVLNDGAEHFLGASYDGSSTPGGILLRQDGHTLSNATVLNSLSATIVGTSSLKAGLWGDAAILPHQGTIRNLAVWNDDLSVGEFDEIEALGPTGDLSTLSFFASKCVLWTKFDATDALGADGFTDHSPSGSDGTGGGDLEYSDAGAILRRDDAWEQLPYGFSPNAPLLSGSKPGAPAYFPNFGGRFFLPFLMAFSWGGTTAQDINVFISNFPIACQIAKAWIKVTTTGSGTLQLRSASGGLGTAYTNTMSTASAVEVNDTLSTKTQLAVGDSMYVRKSSAVGSAGVVYLLILPLTGI